MTKKFHLEYRKVATYFTCTMQNENLGSSLIIKNFKTVTTMYYKHEVLPSTQHCVTAQTTYL